MRAQIRSGVARLRRLPQDVPRIGRARRAVERYRLARGNHLSAAVAFYTVVASVPLVMIVLAGLGVLLFWRSPTRDDLAAAVASTLPSGLTTAIAPVLEAAALRAGSLVGIGALGVLWASTTWTAYLREALSALYRLPPERIASPRRFLWDCGALLVLGLAVLGSLLVTVAVTGLAGLTLDLLGIRDALGGRIALRVVGLGVVLALDWAVLCFVLARLPRRPVALRRVRGPAAVGAVALELLKLGVAVAVRAFSDTAGGAVFGAGLATLFFLFALSRLILILTAWIATVPSGPATPPARGDAASEPDVVEDGAQRLR
ncbi:YihY/virulence factor BrkB family protein [Pseudonocardia spirodelae]|uniref:YihY/virulence factor BrkB family protein n=1 Tax=Pseudonocardia spirodelae TaxID=3133431 RepID=A0ABU8T193_9PSEU